MYKKLAGMTGTAQTEEEELTKIYGTDVVVIPTNLPMIRKDFADVVYKTERGKFRAVIDEIVDKHATGQPQLVGTISIEKSEMLSQMLRARDIPHQVLNAKYHDKEAEIVAQAGRAGTVTIATNMAGRGTDIMLGGNPGFMAREKMKQEGFPERVIAEASEQIPTSDTEVLAARERYRELFEEFKKQTDQEHQQVVALGGLHIIGTERHEARRIDNQLRGRSGRQGDPGSSRFYIALEDDLMRLFGADMVSGFMDKLGFSEDEPIEHQLLSRAIENAQKRVEARNFSIRKSVLEYDDVMNRQREVIYGQRNKVLLGGDLRETIRDMISNVVEHVVGMYSPPSVHPDDWDLQGLVAYAESEFFPEGFVNAGSLKGRDRNEIVARLREAALQAYERREEQIGADILHEIERVVLLRVVDIKWMEHLKNMDDLREGISLRAYGQRDPLIEYTREAFEMFDAMIDSIQHDTVRYLYRVQIAPQVKRPVARPVATGPRQPQSGKRKVGRNDPCPCGSGKKYKHCCGRNL
jgi:preprotein translocase subunit SecA